MKVLYLQTNTINKNSSIYKNIELFYNSKLAIDLGYIKHEHFLELPTWILEISSKLNNVEEDILVINNPIEISEKYDYIFTSVMNSNYKLIYDTIKLNTNITFIVGYYDYLDKNYNNVIHLRSINLIESISLLNDYIIDDTEKIYSYNVFNKYFNNTIQTIPRLALSEGCQYNCKFCTIGSVKRIDDYIIGNKLDAIKRDTLSKIIYIDDKTFIDNHKNYNWLKIIKHNNYNIIVQTTFADFIDMLNITLSLITVVEIGLESYNVNILKKYNKPFANNLKEYSSKTFYKAKENNIYLIFNIIIGFPEENIFTYYNTIKFIYKNRYNLININIYPYTDYSNNTSEDENNLKGIHKLALKIFLKLQKLIIKTNK